MPTRNRYLERLKETHDQVRSKPHGRLEGLADRDRTGPVGIVSPPVEGRGQPLTSRPRTTETPLKMPEPGQVPYEETMQDLLKGMPRIGGEQIEERARAHADLQIDPQIRALQEQKAEARARDLDTAIARGVGRSGVVDWADQQRQKDFTQQVADLERMRGQLTLEEASRLEEQAFQQGMAKLEAIKSLAQQSMQQDAAHWDQWMQWAAFEAQETLDWFDRLYLTPGQKADIAMAWAELFGEMPKGMDDWMKGGK